MIRFYCVNCGEMKEVIFCDLKAGYNHVPWADILCSDCKLVIATIDADKEGKIIIDIVEDK